MPAPAPPHKNSSGISDLSHRVEMVRLAVANEPQFEVSLLELNRPGPHYTVDTAKDILAVGGVELVLLLGADSLQDLPTWKSPTELVSMCSNIGVMRRQGVSVELLALDLEVPGVLAKVQLVEAPVIEISASEIRARVAHGRPFRYMVPPEVYAYIRRHELYRR
jgi:nicotinate-nucleotide adenylyltransferase